MLANYAAVELLVSRLTETERLDAPTFEFCDCPVIMVFENLVGVTDFFCPREMGSSTSKFPECLTYLEFFSSPSGFTFSWL